MNIDRAKEIINQFSSKKILVVGDVVLDQYIRGTVERINPEAPVPILHAHHESEQSGGAGNTAKNAAALGATTMLVSAVGSDATAEKIKVAAQTEGYQGQFSTDPSRPTTRKIRYIAASQQMLRVDYEETHPLEALAEAEVIAAIQSAGDAIAGIIVSDYDKGVITANVARAICAMAKAKNIPLAVDAKPAHAAWFTGATFISPNLKEARAFLGLDPYGHDKTDWQSLATQLHKKMQTGVYLTLSADGMYVVTTDTIGQHVPQLHHVEVTDTSGAGDTATVVLLLSLLCGATSVEAAELANVAGAIVVSKLGAVGVTSTELITALSSLPTKE